MKRERPSQNWLGIIAITCLLAVLGIVTLLFASREQGVQDQLDKQGVWTKGQMHDIRLGARSPRFSYSYVVNGKTYTKSGHVPYRLIQTLGEGQPVGVVYLPSDPDQNRCDIDVTNVSEVPILSMFGYLLLGGSIVFFVASCLFGFTGPMFRSC